MSRRLFALLSVLLFAAFLGRADNYKITIGDITFIRPEDWILEEPLEKSAALSRFLLPNDPKKEVDVRFYIEDSVGRHDDKTWKSHFPQASGKDSQEEKKKIGRRELNILTLRGEYITPGTKIRKHPHFLLISATISFGPKVIHARILGPERLVKPASMDFRRMVENALRDKVGE